ncbi:MAG TPA: NifU family protein [Fluviicola sp.]|nr:NifU family protein [Fluviicola sp.]
MNPITIYIEMTPNPNTMKFVANKYLLESNDSVEFQSSSEAKGYSPIAEALFQFPFVKTVFITANFVTIAKTDNVSWDFIAMELRDFIKDWLTEDKPVLTQIPSPKAPQETSQDSTVSVRTTYAPSEFDQTIIDLLDEYVRPAVERDGGAIDFVGFEDGVVAVALKGSCSGCPSSTFTLKNGIENLLKQHLPAVKEVIAEAL